MRIHKGFDEVVGCAKSCIADLVKSRSLGRAVAHLQVEVTEWTPGCVADLPKSRRQAVTRFASRSYRAM